MNDSQRLVLVGNPNVGKSVVFGYLTGHYVTVSNYPGTTVEVTSGKATLNGEKYEVVDTPGVNSLVPMSEDERVTRDILLTQPVEAVIQVADSRNLARSLLIALQLAELGKPFILDLNMEDEARAAGIKIDSAALQKILGVPVVGTVAVEGKGLPKVVSAISDAKVSTATVKYPERIEEGIQKISVLLPETHISKRSLSLMLLSGDESLKAWLDQNLKKEIVAQISTIYREVQSSFNQPLGYLINLVRMGAADRVVAQVMTHQKTARSSWLKIVGRLSMHPLWGIIGVAAVLYGMYEFVGVFGAGVAVDFCETTLFGKYLNPWLVSVVDFIFRFPHQHVIEEGVIAGDYTLASSAVLSLFQQGAILIHDILVGPYGVFTMALTYAIALILPIVTTFFLAFALMEDTGYLPRLAVMLDRIFKKMGLNGKAIIPMVLGLGCDTMATVTARIMETKKERLIVILLLALGIPCSAQLGIILAILASLPIFYTFVWGGVIVGVIFIVGSAAARILPGTRGDFMMEIPPLRMPRFGNIVAKTFARLEWYLKEVVPIFVLGTFLLFLLDRFKLLGAIERIGRPIVVNLLSLPQEASQAFLIGFLRRDYGATRFFDLYRSGGLDAIQVTVALVTITLFVPCIANFFIVVKERGWKTAFALSAFIFPFAFLIGGLVNWTLRM